MHARVSTWPEGSGLPVDEGARVARERLLPAFRRLAGFQGAITLVDRASGKVTGLLLWETEDAMRASDAETAEIRAEVAAETGMRAPESVEEYEVALFELGPAG